MPQISFYATFEESVAVLQDLCAAGFRIIPEPGPFDSPAAPEFSNVTDELVVIMNKAPTFYLAGPFTHFPIQFDRLPSGPAAGKYAVNPLVEGPVMQCSVGRVRIVEGSPKILPGDVSLPKLYQNPETKAWNPPSAETKAAYKKSATIIKKHGAPRGEGSTSYILPAARKLLDSGQARI